MSRNHNCSCSRRSFLRGSGLALAGFGVSSLFPSALIRQVMAAGTNSSKRLLFIFMRGGNDGINTVIPHGDAQYSAGFRPSLYISPTDAIDLNGFASLHPALGDMMDPYNAGDLAVIHRVGYPNHSQSHFDGQRLWENGDPTQPGLFEGWLYRYIQQNALSAGVNLPVLTAQSFPPLLTTGEERFVNVGTPGAFDYIFANPDEKTKASNIWRNQFDTIPQGLEPYRPILSQTGVKLVDTLDEYRSWDQANWNPLDPGTGWSLFPVDANSNQAGFSPESFEFFAGLKIAALALLESDGVNNNGTRIAGTQIGGWDTHENQGSMGGRQAQLLSWLGYGFKSLRVALSGAAQDTRGYASIWDDTVVLTMSEFGRTSAENGSGGTDHAAASCLFVEGGAVNGGVYNCDPSTWPAGVMLGIDGRYLLERTDYRAVFWELLRDHLGAGTGDADVVFPGYTAAGLGAQELGLIGV